MATLTSDGIMEITWHEQDIRGYTDLLPMESFRGAIDGSELVHDVRSPQGTIAQAKCLVHLNGNEVQLDYTAFRDFNHQHKMIPGELSLVFADTARTKVTALLWCEPNGTRRPADASVSYVQGVARLALVTARQEITENIATFNRGGDQQLAEELLRQTTYWVLDPATKCFGPSKFIGFKTMTFGDYQKARRGNHTGDQFDGKSTRERIEQILGRKYQWDEGLADQLDTWAAQLAVSPNVLKGVDRAKWRFLQVLQDASVLPEEVSHPDRFPEGATHKVAVNAYERSQEARDACIRHYGYSCTICGFDFAQHYGELGTGFIHVHHLKKLADIGAAYEVDPIKDLRPVCPNCHAMIHRQDPPIEIEELKKHVKR